MPFGPVDDYLNTIHEIGAHVGIAPLVESPFNRSKSNVKILEYGLSGMATLASNVEPYKESPCDSVYRPSHVDWASSLKRLENEGYRLRNAQMAQEYAAKYIRQIWHRHIGGVYLPD